MKMISFIILGLLIITGTVSAAGNNDMFTVKYDPNYYAPIVNALKWDIIAPDKKADFFLNIWIEKDAKKILWKDYFINRADNKSIHLYFYIDDPLVGNYVPVYKKKLKADVNFSVQIINKSNTILSSKYFGSILATKKKVLTGFMQRKMKFEESIELFQLNNFKIKHKENEFQHIWTGNPPLDSKKQSFKLILSFTKKSLFFEQESLQDVPQNYYGDYKKLSYQQLIKLKNDLEKYRDKKIKLRKEGKFSLEKLDDIQRNFIEIDFLIRQKEKNLQ